MTQKTDVRAHRRKKPKGGTYPVRKHKRTIKGKKRVVDNTFMGKPVPCGGCEHLYKCRGEAPCRTCKGSGDEHSMGLCNKSILTTTQKREYLMMSGVDTYGVYGSEADYLYEKTRKKQSAEEKAWIAGTLPWDPETGTEKKKDYTQSLIGWKEGVAQVPIHYKYDKKGRKKAYRYSRMQMRWFPISVKEADLQVMTGRSYITPTMKEGVY